MARINLKYATPRVFNIDQAIKRVRLLSANIGVYACDIISLTFSEPLYPYSVPLPSAFTITLSGGPAIVDTITVFGNAGVVFLNLDRSVFLGETGTVTYTPGIGPLQSADRTRDVEAFVIDVTVASSCTTTTTSTTTTTTTTTTEGFTDISFGLLYNAYVVIYNTGGASIAPAGWHIPTEDEWFDLFNEIDTQNTCAYEMKEVGVTHWNTGNGTNLSGFTAVGNGWRRGIDGDFRQIKEASPTWTSSPGYGIYRYSFYAKDIGDDIDETSNIFTNGCAIRLIKNDSTDPGTLTDCDGNIYETVKIGAQVWTKSNLIVKHFNNGVAIPEVTNAAAWIGLTTPAWCYYNNDPANM